MKIESNTTSFNKENLPQVLTRLLAICKTDPNFHLKEKFAQIEALIENLEMKLEKKDALLIESEEIKRGLAQRSDTLDQRNYDLKSSLLESLGSEL